MLQADRNRSRGSALRQDVQDGLLGNLDKTLRINRLVFDMRFRPEDVERVRHDTEAVMAEYELTEAERERVRARDFKGLIELGAHPYLMSQLSRLLFGTGNNRNSSEAAEMLRRSVAASAES